MATFIQGSSDTFALLQGGVRTNFDNGGSMESVLSSEGLAAYQNSITSLNIYHQEYNDASLMLEEMDAQGIHLNGNSIYAMDSMSYYGNPNASMSQWVTAHPYVQQLHNEYGYSYPLVEEGNEDMYTIMNNIARDGVPVYNPADDTETWTTSTDDVSDIGLPKLKWKDKLRLASTYEFLDTCKEYGVDIFEDQLEDTEL